MKVYNNLYYFRFKHMQIRVNAESAAFYKSGYIENRKTDHQLVKLVKTSQKLVLKEYQLNCKMIFVECLI